MAFSLSPDRWPTAFTCADPVTLLSAQHEALRELLDELTDTVDDDGRGDATRAHAIRAAFISQLAWHHGDEEAVFLPRLVGFGSGFDALCASCRGHHRAAEAAAWDVAELVAPVCAGEEVDPVEWRRACDTLRDALEAAMHLEDAALWPVLRRLIASDDREDIAATLRLRAEERSEAFELLPRIIVSHP